MAGLYDQVNGFLNDDRVVDALTDEFGLQTILATRTGVALTVPTITANLSDWMADPSSGSWFRDTVRMVHPESLSVFTSLSRAADYDLLGLDGLDLLLGNRRDDVAQHVAARADIPVAAADGLMAATMWVMTVYLARTYGQHYNREETAGVLAGEYHSLIDQGWGSWLREVAPVMETGSAPARYASPSPSVSHDYQAADFASARRHQLPVTQETQRVEPQARLGADRYEPVGRGGGAEQRRDVVGAAPSGGRVWIYVAGILGALLIVVLVGGAFLLGRLNSETEPETVAAAIESETDDGTVIEEQPETDAETATDDGLDVAQDGQSESDPDVDNWPGGRGPVPDTPPGRRTLEIDESGALVLTGSAPTWEVAMQVLMVAEENYPVEGAAIVNDLTWHPDAAISIRSGDVVMPQAALFVSGSNQINSESLAQLDLAAAILLSSPTVYVVVTGHADAVGDEAVNVSIASERVDATVEYLLAQGVIPGQIVTASAGEDDPTASNDTQEGRQSNRRVELLFKNFLAASLRSGS